MTSFLTRRYLLASVALGVAAWFAFLPPRWYEISLERLWVRFVAGVSGPLLDFLQVPHWLHDATIELPGQALELQRLVGGWGSPLLALVCLSLIVWWRPRPPLAASLVFLVGLLWVMAPATASTILAAGVVYARPAYGAADWLAPATGFISLLLAVVGMLSLNALARFTCSPIPVRPEDNTHMTAWWNRSVAGARGRWRTEGSRADDETLEEQPGRPGWTLDVISAFMHHWYWTRPWRLFARGTPALAVYLGFGVLIWLLRGPRGTETEYAKTATRAWEASQWELAELCYRRLVAENPDDARARWGLAQLAVQRGETDRARRLMHELAPLPEGGNPDAHLWLAEDLRNRDQPLSRDEATELRQHLVHVVRQRPRLTEPRVMLAQWYLQADEPELAMPHLESVVDERPAARFLLADALQSLGRPSEAEVQLRAASDYFRRQVANAPSQTDERLAWARVQIQLGQYDEAARIIENGRELADDDRYQVLLTSLHLARGSDLLTSQPPDFRNALQELHAALSVSPDSPLVLNELSKLTHDQPRSRPLIRQWIEQAIASGHDSPLSRLVLGNIATYEEEFQAAATQYEQGLRMSPESSTLKNNLAWSLAQLGPAELDRAVQLSEEVMQQSSDDPAIQAEYQITRGLVLVRKQRWREAITELESALRVLPDREKLLAGLAEAYEGLGMKDIADAHRQRLRSASAQDASP